MNAKTSRIRQFASRRLAMNDQRNGPRYDQLHDGALLLRAWRIVRRGGPAAGVDGVTLDEFEGRAGDELARLADELYDRRFNPSPARVVVVPKETGGKRRLSIPVIRDRVVLQAMRLLLEPALERSFAPASFAYRPGTGVHAAMERLLGLLRAGRVWVLESDVQDFFDSLSHRRLFELLAGLIADRELLALVRKCVEVGASGGRFWFRSQRGIAQGSSLSPLLANLSLDPFDHRLSCRFALIRYADDLLAPCASRREAEQARAAVVSELGRLGLRINRAKTRIVDSRRESFEFLGFLVEHCTLRPAASNIHRFEGLIGQATNRSARSSIADLLREINPLIRSFGNYYRICGDRSLFDRLDISIRQRIGRWLRQAGQRAPADWRNMRLVRLSDILKAGISSDESARGRNVGGYGGFRASRGDHPFDNVEQE